MTLPQTLKKLRQNIGYTQQQVADALSIERSTYTYYETGKTTPDINTIKKLSKIFNVSYDVLLNSEEDTITRLKVSDSAFETRKVSERCNSVFGSTYDLSKKEKTLLACFRVLTEEMQEKIIAEILDVVPRIKKNQQTKN